VDRNGEAIEYPAHNNPQTRRASLAEIGWKYSVAGQGRARNGLAGEATVGKIRARKPRKLVISGRNLLAFAGAIGELAAPGGNPGEKRGPVGDHPVSIGAIGDVGHHSLLASLHKRDARTTVFRLVRTTVTLGMAHSARCAGHHKKIDFDVLK
jgi:hypothetical protein